MGARPVSNDPLADEPFVVALRAAGATSRGDAVRRADLPEIGDEMLAALVAAQVVGRSDNERYYVVVRREPAVTPAFTPRSVAVMSAFWVVALLLPLVIWLVVR